MARQKNDGRGRLGGRAKGTPNKDPHIKTVLRQHSADYFEPSLDDPENPGTLISQFEIDMRASSPHDRAATHLALLSFHMPKMQAATIQAEVTTSSPALDDYLASLAAANDDPADPAPEQ